MCLLRRLWIKILSLLPRNVSLHASIQSFDPTILRIREEMCRCFVFRRTRRPTACFVVHVQASEDQHHDGTFPNLLSALLKRERLLPIKARTTHTIFKAAQNEIIEKWSWEARKEATRSLGPWYSDPFTLLSLGMQFHWLGVVDTAGDEDAYSETELSS